MMIPKANLLGGATMMLPCCEDLLLRAKLLVDLVDLALLLTIGAVDDDDTVGCR